MTLTNYTDSLVQYLINKITLDLDDDLLTNEQRKQILNEVKRLILEGE